MNQQISPDGAWLWDGKQWVPNDALIPQPGALTNDGHWRWDGFQWVSRQAYFEQQVARHVQAGGKVVARDAYSATVVYSTKINHVLWAILVVLTAGLALLPYLLAVILASSRKRVVQLQA